MQSTYDKIKQETAAGHVDAALRLAEKALAAHSDDAYLLYLYGNAHAKAGRRQEAINAYLKAEAIDPDGPAAEARRLMDSIQAFYHKDLYNP